MHNHLLAKISLASLLVMALITVRLSPVVNAHSGDELTSAYGSSPTIDGILSMGEWDDANTITYPAVDGNCTVYFKHNSSHLHVAFDILDLVNNDTDVSWVILDVDHDGGTPWVQTDDLGFRIYRDGNLTEHHGTGLGSWQSFPVTGWAGARMNTSTRYTTEYSISNSKINVTAGIERTMGLQLVVYNVTGPSSVYSYRWPSGSSYPPDTWGNLSVGKLPPPIFQGDLVLTGNNVTTIEGRFDINGSIIVQENATLQLNNAVINFTQGSAYQFNLTLTNPTNGNPRLFGENATIISEQWLRLYFDPGSLASFNGSTFSKVGSVYVDSANVTMSNSTTIESSWYISGNSQSSMFNCSVNYLLAYDNSNCTVQNSTLLRALVNPHQVNFTVHGLKQGFFNYWKFKENCSVTPRAGGYSPDLTFINTQVDDFVLMFSGTCDVTIMASEIGSFNPYGTITAGVYDSVLSMVVARFSAEVHMFNSTIMTEVEAQNTAKIWLVNSTSPRYDSIGLSEIYLNWYLDVQVIDSIGQDVPSANVTATDPNAALAQSKQTNLNGRTKLILMEKMINVTGEYPVGNYTVEATYSIHTNATAMNMTENKDITLTLGTFVIPEFPSFLLLPLFLTATVLASIICRRKHPPATKRAYFAYSP